MQSEFLCFGTWDEDAWPAEDLEGAEGLRAEEVLERLAQAAALETELAQGVAGDGDGF